MTSPAEIEPDGDDVQTITDDSIVTQISGPVPGLGYLLYTDDQGNLIGQVGTQALKS